MLNALFSPGMVNGHFTAIPAYSHHAIGGGAVISYI